MNMIMRKVIIIISLLGLSNTSIFSNNSIDKILEKYKNDTIIYKKLLDFMSKEIEKTMYLADKNQEDVINKAETYLGTPHCMGGLTKECIDCSGLLVAVFKELGIYLPHDSEEQACYGKIIVNPEDLKEGDLVFFIRTYNTSKLITHSGIYIGENRFIHTSSGSGVSFASIIGDLYWGDKFIFGTRMF